MEKEVIKELNELRKYLKISKDDFMRLLLIAFRYQQNSERNIREEEIYQIIEEAMVNMDYSNGQNNDLDDEFVKGKTIQESFNRALNNLGYQKVKKI